MRKWPIFFLVFMAACIPAAYGSQCMICHGVMTGAVTNSKGVVLDVHIDGEAFAKSVHNSLDCTDCHVSFMPGAHKSPKEAVSPEVAALLPYVSLKEKADPAALAACRNCHPEIYDELRRSVHGEAVFKLRQSDAPLCLDCHGNPHYILAKSDPRSPVNFANVLETCGKCHEDPAITKKYGMSPYVIEKYKESFHGKKYILGDTKVPICDTCHGAHFITKADAPDSPVSVSGRVQTCARCHKGATAKFAAAPVHKYIGKENPVPFYGEKLLILLVFGVFGFTMSHVVLEAWAEMRDNVLRRKEDSDDRR